MVHPKFSPPNAVPGSTLFTFDHRHRLLSRFFSLGFCKAQQPSATLHPAANHLYFPEHFFLPRCLFRLLASLHSLTYFFLYDRYSFDSLAHSSLTLHSTRRQHTLNGTVHTDFELCFTPRFAHSAAAVLMLLLTNAQLLVLFSWSCALAQLTALYAALQPYGEAAYDANCRAATLFVSHCFGSAEWIQLKFFQTATQR